MKNIETHTIDGTEYTIYQMNPSQSIRILVKLLKLAGGSLASIQGKDGLNEDDIATLVLGGLMNNIDEESALSIIKALASHCYVDTNRALNFETHFQGRLGHLMKLCKECLLVQYRDFGDALTDLVPVFSK